MSMRAFERLERFCISYVILDRVTCKECVILALLSDELYGSVTCIVKKILFLWYLAKETSFRSATKPYSKCLALPHSVAEQVSPPPVQIAPLGDTFPEPALHLITPPQPRQCTSSTQKCPPSSIGPSVIRAP